MNSQSTTATPARLWKISAKGPLTPKERKPVVGEPPLIQALPVVVANPKPKTLSMKAQKKTKPIAKRSTMKTSFSLFIKIIVPQNFWWAPTGLNSGTNLLGNVRDWGTRSRVYYKKEADVILGDDVW